MRDELLATTGKVYRNKNLEVRKKRCDSCEMKITVTKILTPD
jgi:hypothetical protein